jgi:hypothetical protein
LVATISATPTHGDAKAVSTPKSSPKSTIFLKPADLSRFTDAKNLLPSPVTTIEKSGLH